MSLWATKSIAVLRAEADAEGEGTLKKTLTATNLITLGIGAIIGAGIFVLTGLAAARNAGPAVPLSFVAAGIACGFAGLCYAEMASAVPVAGSAYTYSYATMGEFMAWIIGWDLVLEYAMGASTVGVGWSGYFVSLLQNFGIDLPKSLTSAPYRWCETTEVATGAAGCVVKGLNPTGAIVNVPAVVIVAIMSIVLVIGIRESAKVNNWIVALKLGVIALFIVAGVFYINPANWHPFIPPNTGEFGHFGISGIFRGAGLIFFAYIGFDAVSTAAQEAKNPQRDMPVGILGSLGICTLLYIVVSAILTGIMPYTMLDVSHPVGFAVDNTPGLSWMAWIINLGAVLGLASVILVMLLGQSRVFYSMSRDGLLPAWVARIHPRFRTPYLTQIFVGIFAGFFAGVFPIQLLGELVNIGTLLAFVLVCGGIIILRRTRPDLNRPFRTPWVPLVPILGILSCLGLMATLPVDTWIRLFVWMIIGLVIYFAYGRRHSTLHTGEDKQKFAA
ncbi:MAG TPA: amino acid permease [Gemmatimonadales bacterium]|nr:amino acid permease [Gemmatimonadales bacterium]